ncbi:Dual specificity testis-specific protein kinase 2, partial [Blomia tropicalis]
SPSSSSLNPLQTYVQMSPEATGIITETTKTPSKLLSELRNQLPTSNSNTTTPQPKLMMTTNEDGEHQCTRRNPLPCCDYSPTLSSIREAVSHLTRLDDFSVVKLSHGFFSQVFKVIHFSTKKVMVLKMNKEAGNRGNALKEIELLNKLNHENIVSYMGTVVHEGALHPLLEFINGGTLEQLIRTFYTFNDEPSMGINYSTGNYANSSGRSLTNLPKIHRLRDPDWTFIRLMRNVACGMDYLHTSGYLHRDLASKNIFIRKYTKANNCDPISMDRRNNVQSTFSDNDWFDDERLEAVIGDFGFATTEPTADQKLSIVGSPYWLAPECFKNMWYNHKCDIYSFGVICCELNWRIPADPDYLPRCDDYFAVDFTKLDTKKDTVLAKMAIKTCQIDPNLRPEFSSIMDLFDIELNKLSNSKEGIKMNDQTQVGRSTMTSSLKRGFSVDSSLSSSQSSSTALINKDDVFEQHLLRRRFSLLSTSENYVQRHHHESYCKQHQGPYRHQYHCHQMNHILQTK